MIKDRSNSGLTSPNNPNNPSGGDVPEGVSFDGATDYLSRSTDLVGNVDSKTFTFSCWVYADLQIGEHYIYSGVSSGGNKIYIQIVDNVFSIYAYNSSNVAILNMRYGLKTPYNTWSCLSVSIDLSNAANRQVYINDTPQSGIQWAIYTNDFINFTSDSHNIGANVPSGGAKLKGRLSNLFLAYEYVDLSIESNRRMFITADGKPA